MLAIIGGTGLTELENLHVKKRVIVRTPYGEPSQPLIFGEICGGEVIFWRDMVLDTRSRRMK